MVEIAGVPTANPLDAPPTTTGAHTMNIDAKAREIAANFAIPQTNANFGFIRAALLAVRNEALEDAAKVVAREASKMFQLGRTDNAEGLMELVVNLRSRDVCAFCGMETRERLDTGESVVNCCDLGYAAICKPDECEVTVTAGELSEIMRRLSMMEWQIERRNRVIEKLWKRQK